MPDLLEEFEDASPPTDMRSFQDWDNLLEEGETVLWEGFEEPYEAAKSWQKHHRTTSYVIIVAGALIGLSLSPIGWIVASLGAFLWLVSSPLKTKHQTIYAYAISDRHAFIHERNARDRRMRIAHSRIDKVILVEGPPDQLYFGQKSDATSASPGMKWRGFALPPTSSNERFGGVVSALTSTDDLNDTSKTLIGFYNIPNGHEAAQHLSQAKENAL